MERIKDRPHEILRNTHQGTRDNIIILLEGFPLLMIEGKKQDTEEGV